MTLFMLAGTLCFSLFMLLALGTMQAFSMSKRRVLLFSVLAVLFLVAVECVNIFIHLTTPQIVGIMIVVLVIMLTVFFKDVPKAISFTIYVAAFAFGVEGSTLLILRLFGHTPEYPSPALPYLIIALGLFLISFLLRYLIKKRSDMLFFNDRVMYFLLACASVTLVLMYMNLVVPVSSIVLGTWVVGLNDIAYVLFFISSVITFFIIMRYAAKEAVYKTEMLHAEASKKYVQELEESYKKLRTIKHDYLNILSSFKLYIDDKDMDGLARYYHNELAEMNRELLQQDKLIGSLQNLDLPEVKSVLVYKCSGAVQQEIDTTIEILEPVTNLGVSTAIICQMLGILLDNAIEAALEVGEDERKLQIAIIKNRGSKTFIIKNTWKEIDIPISNMFEYRFSTKGKSRGEGLSTVRSYLDRNRGLYLETDLTDGFFTQKLTVKDN